MTVKLPCSVEELKTLFLFEKLNDEQLAWLCRDGHVVELEPGPVFNEGDPATCFYVLLDGTVVLSRLSGGQNMEMVRTSHRGAYAGAWQAYLGDRVAQVHNTSMRVPERSRFFVLDAHVFADMMGAWFPMAVHLLEGLFFGNRNAQQQMGQRDRLLALGSLSAGLTHELNNPAAAAVRATATLRERVSGMRHKLGAIASGHMDRTTLAGLVSLQEDAVEHCAKAPKLTAMQASDAEDELSDWFDDHQISNGWEIAPTFVQAGLDTQWLEGVSGKLDGDVFKGAVKWLNYTVETEQLMNEIEDSVSRISTLVAAAKQYSQMDRAPYQEVDVHELLDSTLTMLGGKFRDGISVVKEYDSTLPKIPAFGAELNQVWTNLIDNAVGAMTNDGRSDGTLTVRTSRDNEMLLVEICDTGSGVPEDIQGRIFEPFFSTKAVGEGTGLGLDISWRIVVTKHHGDLRVQSVPGDTRFQVRLPLVAPANVD